MSNETGFKQWAILELMGHVRLAGLVSEEQLFGAAIGRVDIPQRDGSLVTQYFGGSSIYRLTPTTEEIARAVAAKSTPAPVQKWDMDLSVLLPPVVEGDFSDEIDF